uniref:Uncharacterized protein n=1 Tax=Arundo donax TaxID=35708 RepID=A0A0A9BSE8_ARUDO
MSIGCTKPCPLNISTSGSLYKASGPHCLIVK